MRFAVFILSCLCDLTGLEKLNAQPVPGYRQEMEAWQQRRINSLKAEEGWINLAGLFWLEAGINRFGTAPDNQLIFPEGSLPAYAGYLIRTGKLVKLVVDHQAPITVNGQLVQEAVVFDPDDSVTATMRCGPWKWVIIQRGEKIGIRLRNLESPLLQEIQRLDYFPIDSGWRVRAKLVKPMYRKTIPVTNVLGQTNQLPSPGKLLFEIGGVAYTLDALEEGDELFVIFGDATNGSSTYPSGRFLYADLPGANGMTILDFNKAFNPPCAFTPYATCPLPPPQNRLPLPIIAGEKLFHISNKNSNGH